MLIGVPRETAAGETRVAATPETTKKLKAQGHTIRVESGAGVPASVTDDAFAAAGAEICDRAGALQEPGGHGRIDAAGEADDDAVQARRGHDGEEGCRQAAHPAILVGRVESRPLLRAARRPARFPGRDPSGTTSRLRLALLFL